MPDIQFNTFWHVYRLPMPKSIQMKTNKRIFIVDDDQFWTSMLTQMLNDLGYTNIVTFSNGTDCIKNLHLNPAIVFLDYQMEDVNGLQVLPKIKDYFPRIGVVFCTAHEDLSVAVDAMKFGSFDYLLKANANSREVSSIIKDMIECQVLADKMY
jgi:DNA-binding NtrC family response regulator